jgi:hypothetical protein
MSEKSNPEKTIESLNHPEVTIKDIIYIDNLFDIDYGKIETDWWLLLYDDEIIEDRLVDTFPFIRDQWLFDCFSFYKRDVEGNITFCPRLFKKEVTTRIDYLYPVEPVRLEILLDGWVLEQGCSV